MARLPYVDSASAPPETAKVLSRLPELHVFGLVAHAESAFVPWLRYGQTVLSDLSIPALLRELVILQVGRLAARYEWDQHVPIAQAAGATDEQIAALDRGETTAPCFTATHTAVLAVVADMVRDGEVDDATYAALAAQLEEQAIVEVMLTAGHYLGLARMMTALRIDPDPAAGPEALSAGT